MMSSVKRLPKAVLIGAAVLGVAVVAVVAIVLASGGSSSSDQHAGPAAPTPQRPAKPTAPPAKRETVPVPRGAGYANVDLSNTRHARGAITAANVSKLSQAWSHAFVGKSTYGSFASTPVVHQGVVYLQDLASNVEALSLRTGKVLWTQAYDEADQGPNGIAIAGGRVFGATGSMAFALDQRTGKELWRKVLTRSDQEGIDMTPGYHDGMVYVSTVPGNAQQFYNGGGVGILWALDAKTGKKRWTFKTIPNNLWGNKDINSGGGLWYPPAFDGQGNMYFGTGNPAPFPGTDDEPWGKSRPGRNLYTNSLVKMNAKTGKLQWYYQMTPHDLYDWDLQDPPILTKVGGRPAVVTAGKVGYVIAVDRQTGKLLWKRSVGIHNGHDRDPQYALKKQYSKLHMPEEVYPGLLGGVIAPLSTDGQRVFAPVVNNSVQFQSQTQQGSGQSISGELVAIDVDTGKRLWDKQLASAAFGATTVVNDVVFVTTFDGQVYGFNTKNGKQVWNVQLPGQTNAGVMVSGNTLLAAAGLGNEPALIAYKLGG